jgi:hypothetical protein
MGIWKSIVSAALCIVTTAAISGCGGARMMADDIGQGFKKAGTDIARGVTSLGTDEPAAANDAQPPGATAAIPAGDAQSPQSTAATTPPVPQSQADQQQALAQAPNLLSQQISGVAEQLRQPLRQQPQIAAGQQPPAQAPAVAGRGAAETLAPGRYRATCKDFVGIAAEQQKTDVWCWAACVQMVNKYNGRQVTQAEIAGRIHGKATDASGRIDPEKVKRAGTLEIMLAMNPDLHDHFIREGVAGLLAGRDLKVEFDPTQTALAWFQEKTYSDDHMIADLARGVPVVVGLKDPGNAQTGHAYVVHAATYGATPGALNSYTYSLESVEAVDPWTGRSVTIPADQFRSRVGFKISQQLARDVLIKHRQALKVTAQ